jgi:hypothetical protein
MSLFAGLSSVSPLLPRLGTQDESTQRALALIDAELAANP